jgi:multidrug efflux pump subunit AcrA (membrane-fusion protein)
MKRIFAIMLILLFLAAGRPDVLLPVEAVAGAADHVHDRELATTGDIVQKTVATGSIVPRQEVEIKPRVSGVIETLFVEPGKARQARRLDRQDPDRARRGQPATGPVGGAEAQDRADNAKPASWRAISTCSPRA